MDISPTSVPAVSCQAVSPLPIIQYGYGLTVFTLLQGLPVKGPTGTRGSPPGLAGPAPAAPLTCLQRLMFPMDGFRGHFLFVTRAVMCLATSRSMFQTRVVTRPLAPPLTGVSHAWA